MKAFSVLAPGLATTAQDLGRQGFSSIGISRSGAYDPFAARCANLLAGNPESATLLEITYQGPSLVALETVTAAITGASLNPTLEEEPLPLWETFQIKKGAQLSFERRQSGCRAYLAVAGGFTTSKLFSSSARDVRCGFGGFVLAKDMILETGEEPRAAQFRTIAKEIKPVYESPRELRVVLGPDLNYFKKETTQQFLSSRYQVTSRSDRSGCRLEGPRLDRLPEEMLSEPVMWGIIQVPPDGNPIILGPECQHVGGYPRLAAVIQADFPKLAQAFIHEELSFHAVSLEEASERWQEQNRLLNRIRDLCTARS